MPIGPRFQELYVHDTRLMLDTVGIEDGGTVVVKHSRLSTWKAYLKLAVSFKETYYEMVKNAVYDMLEGFAKDLKDSGFYLTYPGFTEKGDEISKMLFTFHDRTRGVIQKSAQVFFEGLYNEKTLKIMFGSKTNGTREGWVCVVELDDQTRIKYYVKTHHGAGHRTISMREDPDLKEFFAYKLLEKIRAGAEVHFVTNVFESRWIIYIASRDISGFRTINEIEREEGDSGDLSKYKRPVVQMLFLYSVLDMIDHHSSNMGIDEKGLPFIIDFALKGRRTAFNVNNSEDFYDEVRHADKINEFLGTPEERLKIAKKYLKNSDFVRKVDETLKSFSNENKKRLEDQKLCFGSKQKTEGLQHYVERIKENASKFKNFYSGVMTDFEMRNFHDFSLEKSSYDLKLELLEELDPKEALELMKVNKGFRSIYLKDPWRIVGRHVYSVGFTSVNYEKFVIIRKLSRSTTLGSDLRFPLPLLKKLKSCTEMRYGPTQQAIDIISNLDSIGQWCCNCGLETFNECFSNFKGQITDFFLMDLRWCASEDQNLSFYSKVFETQLGNCKEVLVNCRSDQLSIVCELFSKSRVKKITCNCVVWEQSSGPGLEKAMRWIVCNGIPSRNREAEIWMRIWEQERSDSAYLCLETFFSTFPGMQQIPGENGVLRYRRKIDDERDCVYELGGKEPNVIHCLIKRPYICSAYYVSSQAP